MNLTTYTFCSFDKGYYQYPHDNTESIFRTFYAQSQAPTQVAIYRSNFLMYYGYIRKLESNHYIGLSIVLNSVMLTDLKAIFGIFEKVIAELVLKGSILQFDETGNIVSKAAQFNISQSEISEISERLRFEFSNLEDSSKILPPPDYSILNNEIRKFSIGTNENEVIDASCKYGYTFIYKQQDYDTLALSNYRKVLQSLNKENKDLKSSLDKLKSENRNLKNKQRNTLWVGVLSIAVIVLGFILYIEVINPSEVTKFATADFLYYGPLKNKKPDGEGVAFYLLDDKFGRRYYIGNFKNGVRMDSKAMLYYTNGDYFYGSIKGDNFESGIFYSNSDNAHFEGSFVDNNPYEGTWYKHEPIANE